METSMEVPQKTEIKLPYDLAMPILGIYILRSVSEQTVETPAHPSSNFHNK
jgi:hypothetical protein